MNRATNTVSTISISLLLLLIGVVGFFVLGISGASRELAQGVKVTVILDSDVTPAQRSGIERIMSDDKEVLSYTYVSSEMATQDFESSTGIKIDTLFGAQPLPQSFDITPISLSAVESLNTRAATWSGVTETFYPRETAERLSAKIEFAWKTVLSLGALLTLVTLMLIYLTTKLSILGSAESIRTMQLVGARNSFIKRPYIRRAVIQGFVAALVASGLLVACAEIFAANMDMAGTDGAEYWQRMAMIASALCLGGVTLCTLFTTIVLRTIVKKRRK